MSDPSIELLTALEESRELGFLGPGPVSDHVTNALAFASALDEFIPDWTDTNSAFSATGLDIGSGGGVPGLVLADVFAHMNVSLLDASAKRTAWLRDVQNRLTSPSKVIEGRAELLARQEDLRERFDWVSARSFGIPAATLECSTGFVRKGGLVLISETPHDREWAATRLAEIALERVGVHRTPKHGIVVFMKTGPTPDRYPRRDGVPVRKPLFEL